MAAGTDYPLSFSKAFAKKYVPFKIPTTITHSLYLSLFIFFKSETTITIAANKKKPNITLPANDILTRKSIAITSFYLTIEYIPPVCKKASYQFFNADGYPSSSSSFPIPFGQVDAPGR
jgi:hypothetical protein